MSNPPYKKSVLKRSALAAVLGLCLSQAAMAQSTAGDIVGSASYVDGAQIQITNPASGVSRSVQLGADGKFRIPSLPSGQYQVNLVEGGNAVSSITVTVVAGKSVSANFADANASAKELDAVTVKAPMVVSGIDTSSVETRTTFTAKQLTDLPVPQDVTSVATLTPGTVQGSSAFGNLASFGGASVAENAYYVNGMNITNSYDSMSFSEVPWQAIDQLDVQTGGYGAEYGFSTGGVISVNIKRGTNEWHGGISADFAPDATRAHVDDEYYNDGTLFRPLSQDKTNDNTYAIWESGPLIKDKLFFFAIAQVEQETGSSWDSARSSETSTSTTMHNYSENKPYKLVKLDWYLNDWNHLEFTGFDNSSRSTYSYYGMNYSGNSASRGDYNGQLVSKSGGPTTVFKWTSNLTDNLTLEAQYGHMHQRSEQYTISPDGTTSSYDGNINSSSDGCPYVYYSSNYSGSTPSCSVSSSLGVSNGYSDRDDYRLDFDWTLGDHDLKFGYDYNDFTAKQGESYSGGHYYYYYDNDTVYDYVYKTGGSDEVKQNSWYIQDHWHVTDNFLLSIGVRNDSFKNYNTDGEVFVKQDNIWEPRFGFSWDINGDGMSRLYGNLGRYALPISANVALRAASASYYTRTQYSYTGISSNGTPTGLSQVGDTLYVNGENGSVPNAASVTAKNLKPYTQDEAILGYDYTLQSDNDFLNNWVLGIKGTYRRVHNAIDDSCATDALYEAASAAGYDTSSFDEWDVPDGTAGCWLYNPGSAATITTTIDGEDSTVTMSADSLGPKAKRTYQAVTLSAQKATDKWYGSFSYTWSKSKGNYEGLVDSDSGQTDTGTTAAFDYAALMEGSYGYLPNDHRHSIKLYGGYKFTPEWMAGVSIQAQSGAPESCYGGGYGTLGNEAGYTGSFHYCNGEISERGTAGRLPWTFDVSPNVTYKPAALPGFSAQLSLMNLFNNVKPLQIYETREEVDGDGEDAVTYDEYRLGQYYTTPRYVRLQLMYQW